MTSLNKKRFTLPMQQVDTRLLDLHALVERLVMSSEAEFQMVEHVGI